MCEWGKTVELKLVMPAYLSHTGVAYVKPCGIDECIAPLVKALNDGGITTVASCCGHGRTFGAISLADGTTLMIFPDYETAQIAGDAAATPEMKVADKRWKEQGHE